MQAAFHTQKSSTKVLLSKGADKRPTCVCSDGKIRNAAELAKWKGHQDLANLIESWQTRFEPGEPLGQQMMIMTRSDNAEQLEMIMNKGVSVDYRFSKVRPQLFNSGQQQTSHLIPG